MTHHIPTDPGSDHYRLPPGYTTMGHNGPCPGHLGSCGWSGSLLARELDRLYAELDKLRAILREHGIDAGDDPA
jgi:hypothetical protein